MNSKTIAQGRLWAGFKGLDGRDLEKILHKLNAHGEREPRPRKCRRLKGFHEIISLLPPPVPLTYFNVVGNEQIGNEGTKHLHLLPDTVVDLDLSQCRITLDGVKNVCSFLKTNKSVTRFIMWGNHVGDEGAKYIAEMLKVNKTLRILCLSNCHIGSKGFSHLGDALVYNDTLRELDLGGTASDKRVHNLACGLENNRGLETLDVSGGNVTVAGLLHLEAALEVGNMTLTSIKMDQPDNEDDWIDRGHNSTWNRICYWTKLNIVNRKAIEDEDATLSDHVDGVVASSEKDFLDGIYFFLRNSPALCKCAAENRDE